MHLAKASVLVEGFAILLRLLADTSLLAPTPHPFPSLEDGYLKDSQEEVTGWPDLFVLEPSSGSG